MPPCGIWKLAHQIRGRVEDPYWDAAGFDDAKIVGRHDIFADVPNPSSATEFGTKGISLRVRKPV